MNISLNELLNNSFVITVSDSKYQKFCDYFAKANLTPYPKKFFGFQIKDKNRDFPSKLNCTLSHLALIKMANTLNMPFICIFEDDAVPHKDILNLLAIQLSDIPQEAIALKLGWMRKLNNNVSVKINENLITINARGAQAYIVFKQGYSKFIEYMSNKDCIIDMGVLHLPNIYATKTNLFVQYNGENAKHSSRGNIGINKNKLKTIYKINPNDYQI